MEERGSRNAAQQRGNHREGEQHVGNDSIPKEDQHSRSDQFSETYVHGHQMGFEGRGSYLTKVAHLRIGKIFNLLSQLVMIFLTL
jgi:hypothetical protein